MSPVLTHSVAHHIPDIMFLDSLNAAAFSKRVTYIYCKKHEPLRAHANDRACGRTYKDDPLLRKLLCKSGILAEEPITWVYSLPCVIGEQHETRTDVIKPCLCAALLADVYNLVYTKLETSTVEKFVQDMMGRASTTHITLRRRRRTYAICFVCLNAESAQRTTLCTRLTDQLYVQRTCVHFTIDSDSLHTQLSCGPDDTTCDFTSSVPSRSGTRCGEQREAGVTCSR